MAHDLRIEAQLNCDEYPAVDFAHVDWHHVTVRDRARPLELQRN